MGLIADLVSSVLRAFPPTGIGYLWRDETARDDLSKLAEGWAGAVTDFTEKHQVLTSAIALVNPVLLGGFTVLGLLNPRDFVKELFEKWDGLLSEALARLNVEVERPDAPAEGQELLFIQATLIAGREGAQERVSAALAVINFIVIAGNVVSVAAEALSAGAVRSIAEAIQSWVWANGLGSFTPLAFQPQVNASINPYLTRWYNARAKAQIPPVTDIIRFQLREVYLAGRREELIGTEARPIFDTLMAEWGFDKFHADSYWGAHWQLPSVGQLNEMLFRGVIDRETWERFVRFNDLEPSSIPRLAEIIFNPYTRVDVRRMARVGILNDDETLQAYADLGNFAPTAPDTSGRLRAQFVANPDFTVHKAQALVVFTKVFNALPELRSRFSKGWISADEVLAELLGTGIPPLRARAIFETIVKSDGPARTAPERELTRALITRAWKLRLISFTQATFLLERQGWSVPEAELILRVQSEPDDPLAFVSTSLGVALGAGRNGTVIIEEAEL